MRSIKFRMRIKDKSTGYEVDMFIPLFDEGLGLMQYPVDLNDWEVLNIDEWTGLKDRNGKEIYEGDMFPALAPIHGEVLIVCYDSNQARFKAVPSKVYKINSGNGGWTGLALNPERWEIIGNIHEHPHLLKGEEE